MRKFIIVSFLIGCVLISAFTVFQAMSYKVSDAFSIKFKNSKVSGSFNNLQGNIVFDVNHLDQSSFDMTVETGSIKTGNFLKNSHAKGSNWFDADRYPVIKFVSDKFTKTGDKYQVTGTLEMHGVKKQVSIPFTFANNTFTGGFTLNRLDYKVGDMEGMSAKVPADIELELSVPVKKK